MKFAICTSAHEDRRNEILEDGLDQLPTKWQDQVTAQREGYWYVELETLEDLLALVHECRYPIIVNVKEDAGMYDPVDVDTLLVYDGYIE